MPIGSPIGGIWYVIAVVAAVAVLALRLRVELTALAPGITDAGENEQPKLPGSPEHVSATALLNEPD